MSDIDHAAQDLQVTKELVVRAMRAANDAGANYVSGCFMCGGIWVKRHWPHTLIHHFPYWIVCRIATSRLIGESNRQAGDAVALMYHRKSRRLEKP